MGPGRFYRKTGKKTGEGGDDGAAAPHAGGGGDGSCDPPTDSADSCACSFDGTWAPGGGALGRARA